MSGADPRNIAANHQTEQALRPPHCASSSGHWFKGFTLHVLTGVLAVAAHYSLMWLLLQFGAHLLAASGLGFLAGATTRYLLSYYKVFGPSGSVPATLLKFVPALGGQLLCNLALLDLLTRAGILLWLAQATSTFLLTVVNYLVYRLWVFR